MGKRPGHLALGVLVCGRFQEAMQSRTSWTTCTPRHPQSVASQIVQDDKSVKESWKSWEVSWTPSTRSPGLWTPPGSHAVQDILDNLHSKTSTKPCKSNRPGSLVKCPGHLALGVLDCGRLQEAIQSRTSRKTCSHKCPRSLASESVQEDL